MFKDINKDKHVYYQEISYSSYIIDLDQQTPCPTELGADTK